VSGGAQARRRCGAHATVSALVVNEKDGRGWRRQQSTDGDLDNSSFLMQKASGTLGRGPGFARHSVGSAPLRGADISNGRREELASFETTLPLEMSSPAFLRRLAGNFSHLSHKDICAEPLRDYRANGWSRGGVLW
jgi:hypothetical protein